MFAQSMVQLVTRSGDPGQENAQPVMHGQFNLGSRGGQAEFRAQLRDVLEAADHLTLEGKVTEISVLVYGPGAMEVAALRRAARDNPELS